ncbi:hypothetical protein DSECCO2_558220 [anaerobic digester metagenome]
MRSTGCLTPPTSARASSRRSLLGVRGMSALLPTSPTSVTLDVLFLTTRTSTWGWLALPCRRLTMTDSISWVVRPLTGTRPAKGTVIMPSKLTIWPGRVTACEVMVPSMGLNSPAPNSMAGGVSQTEISMTSPGPTRCVSMPDCEKIASKRPSFLASASRLARESLTSTSWMPWMRPVSRFSCTCCRLAPEEESHPGMVAQPDSPRSSTAHDMASFTDIPVPTFICVFLGRSVFSRFHMPGECRLRCAFRSGRTSGARPSPPRRDGSRAAR